MVKADSKTGAGKASRLATRYPGNNLNRQPVSYPRPIDGRLFCPLKPMATYYEATATAHDQDSIPGASRSKAVRFDLPYGEPKRLVKSRALAGSRPGSPYCLSYHLATTDCRPASQGHRPDAAEEHLTSPQAPWGSRGARGSGSPLGQGTPQTCLGLWLRGSGLRLTSRVRSAEPLPDSARQLLRWRTGELAVLHMDYLHVRVIFKHTYESYRHLSL